MPTFVVELTLIISSMANYISSGNVSYVQIVSGSQGQISKTYCLDGFNFDVALFKNVIKIEYKC